MRFRPFSNSDPPLLAELWNAQSKQRSLVASVTPELLEQYVFSKPYFDRHGLIVALDSESDRLVGFVHVGFGPNDARTDLDTTMGVVCMLMVAPGLDYVETGRQLLEVGEAHLKERGSQVIYGGCVEPLNPFYLGLYGGSELPGVLQSDPTRLDLLQRHGYEEIDRVIVLQKRLVGYRPLIDRRQIQLRRRYRVELDTTPPEEDWWSNCTSPPSEPTRYELYPVQGGPACGNVSFWVMEPFSVYWGELSVGMSGLTVTDELKRQGLATFLNSESLRQLQMNGVQRVEVQTMQSNTAALGLYEKLGFEEVDQGVVLRRRGPENRGSSEG